MILATFFSQMYNITRMCTFAYYVIIYIYIYKQQDLNATIFLHSLSSSMK